MFKALKVCRACLMVEGVLSLMAVSAMAQSAVGYPNRPLRMIIPFAPGGGIDLVGRIVAAELSRSTGQSVVPVNDAGAGGSVGLAKGLKATPDGYTLILMSSSTLVNQYVSSNIPYNLLRDFAPLSQLCMQPSALVIHPSVPAKSVKELIAYAKANPGRLSYGSSGTGGTSHLMGALFGQMAGVSLVHVPYKGGGQAIIDTMAGSIQMQFSTLGLAGPHIKSGKLRALAMTSAQRVPAAPDLPTIAEAGLPGYEVVTWHGLMLPLNTPRSIIAQLNHEIARIIQLPEVTSKFAVDGFQGVGGTPDQFAALLKAESVTWAKLVKDINLKAE